jgi:hypothetical protein
MSIIDVFVIDKSVLATDEKIVNSFMDIANDIAESVESSALFFTSTDDFVRAYKAGLELLSFRLWIHYIYNKHKPKDSKGFRTAKKISEKIDTLKINLLTRETDPESINDYKAYCTDDVIDLIKKSFASVPFNSPYMNHKIFISHSSKDIEIIKGFTNKILGNGLGFDIDKRKQKIYCTSIENLGIKTGQDFRRNIKEHLLNANIVLLFLSENYKNSDICLNEMGASWAYEKTVFPLIIPPMDFKGVGALMEVNECVKLDSEDRLLKVCDELNEKFQLNNEFTKMASAVKNFIKEHIKV